MKAKRLISILLVLAIVGSFASCRKNPKSDGGSDYDSDYSSDWYEEEGESEGDDRTDASNTSGGSKGGTATGTNGGTNSGSKNLEGNTYLSGFPIVKKKESLKIMAIIRAADIGDTNKSQFTKTYSKMTNIDIKFDLVNDELMSQRKTLALQSGNLPDIFARGCKITDQDVQQYGAEGVFVEITKDMLKKYAPNIYKFYNDYNLWVW